MSISKNYDLYQVRVGWATFSHADRLTAMRMASRYIFGGLNNATIH